jgi:hypothetical protein
MNAVIVRFARTTGAVTRRFTGKEVGEAAMNLTAIGMRLLRVLRESKVSMPERRAIAREIRQLRQVNARWV